SLGNRPALAWVISPCQINTDERSGITPNRPNDEQYIVRRPGRDGERRDRKIGQQPASAAENVMSAQPPFGRRKPFCPHTSNARTSRYSTWIQRHSKDDRLCLPRTLSR